jgi:hypothetical protein
MPLPGVPASLLGVCATVAWTETVSASSAAFAPTSAVVEADVCPTVAETDDSPSPPNPAPSACPLALVLTALFADTSASRMASTTDPAPIVAEVA